MQKKIFFTLTLILMMAVCGFSEANRIYVKIDNRSKELTSSKLQKIYCNFRAGSPRRFEPMPFELLNDIFNYDWSLGFRTFYNDDPSCRMRVVIYMDKRDEGYEVTAGADIFECSRESYQYDFPSIQEFEDILVYIRENSEFFFDYSEFDGVEPGHYIQPESGEYFTMSAHNSDIMDYDLVYKIVTEFTDDPPVSDEIAWVFDRLRELRDEILLHPLE